jgi:hypothetical protein
MDFWAESSFGDTSEVFHARLRVVESGVSADPAGRGWYVDVLSSQWQGQPAPVCAQMWDTFLPVVNTDQFNHPEPIIAFVPFRITQVVDTGSAKGITGQVIGLAECGSALPGSDVNCGVLAPPKAVN